jgi:hypothetical protein
MVVSLCSPPKFGKAVRAGLAGAGLRPAQTRDPASRFLASACEACHSGYRRGRLLLELGRGRIEVAKHEDAAIDLLVVQVCCFRPISGEISELAPHQAKLMLPVQIKSALC